MNFILDIILASNLPTRTCIDRCLVKIGTKRPRHHATTANRHIVKETFVTGSNCDNGNVPWSFMVRTKAHVKTSFSVALLNGQVQQYGVFRLSLCINVDALPEHVNMCFEKKRVNPINTNFEDVVHSKNIVLKVRAFYACEQTKSNVAIFGDPCK